MAYERYNTEMKKYQNLPISARNAETLRVFCERFWRFVGYLIMNNRT